MTNNIHPCLWFNGEGKAAANLYCSIFKNSRITVDTPMVINFELHGQKFMALNGGPHFKINPSISFAVACETESEIDDTWKKLMEGGSALMPLDKYDWSTKYGWVQDKFGVNWQLSLGQLSGGEQKITSTLMFTEQVAGKAAEAMELYASIFDNSGINMVAKYTAGESDAEGNIKYANFHLGDQHFAAMDSSATHGFTFNEAVSLVVDCQTQQEIDHYWYKLSKGGSESQCGWLKDPYGVSWQIVPALLGKLMSDPEKAPRVMQAFMKMKKFDIEQLKNA